jgi:hypothetical protein
VFYVTHLQRHAKLCPIERSALPLVIRHYYDSFQERVGQRHANIANAGFKYRDAVLENSLFL